MAATNSVLPFREKFRLACHNKLTEDRLLRWVFWFCFSSENTDFFFLSNCDDPWLRDYIPIFPFPSLVSMFAS